MKSKCLRFANVLVGPEHAFFGGWRLGWILDNARAAREVNHLLPALRAHVAPSGHGIDDHVERKIKNIVRKFVLRIESVIAQGGLGGFGIAAEKRAAPRYRASDRRSYLRIGFQIVRPYHQNLVV